jgi:PhnB protein
MAEVRPIPDDYPRITPYLHVDGAADAIEFYKSVLGATERARMGGSGGRIGHAELAVGDSMIMLADEYPVSIHVYVADVDAAVAAALAAGATQLREVTEEFYGDRIGSFEDPWGHLWHLASRVEDVSPEEMERRAAAQEG